MKEMIYNDIINNMNNLLTKSIIQENSILNIDTVYIYVAIEGIITADFFFIADGIVYRKEKILSLENYIKTTDDLIKCYVIKEIIARCKRNNRSIPTEMRIIFNRINNTFETAISHNKHFSARKINANPGFIFNKWFEDTKKEYEEKYEKQDES
jgi:hypothetical protein